MSILGVIKNRRSVRNFSARPLSAADGIAISAATGTGAVGPFGHVVRFSLLQPTKEKPDALNGLSGALGTYGFIKHAQAFVIGAVESGALSLCDFGYLMENAVLAAAEVGVGSCWLGGSFRPGPFGKVIRVRENESVPAVIALGYPAPRRKVMDKLIEMHHVDGNRRANGSSRFFEANDFSMPADPKDRSVTADLFAAVHCAPSSCNTQPWRIVHAGANVFHFYFTRNLRYSKKDRLIGNADLQLIDMGIAMRHFDAVASELNIDGAWRVVENTATLYVPSGSEYLVSWTPAMGS